MSTSSPRLAGVAAGVCLGVVAVAAAVLARLGPPHFVPEQELTVARAQGDGCLLFLGDSRMAAGFDGSALHAALAHFGRDRCLANLAIGGTDMSGAFLTARRYLALGRRPRAAILGIAGDYPLGPPGPLRPEEMIGNNAIHLVWTQARDLFAEVPDFPGGGIDSIDRAFRFLALRATPFGRYQSLFAHRLQGFDRRLAGTAVAEHNQFGAVEDMAALETRLQQNAVDRLAAALRAPADQRTGPRFRALEDLLRASGVPLVVVELPMPRAFRAAVTDATPAVAYRQWLRDHVQAAGGLFVDVSHPDWVTDRLFVDALHLGAAGAAKLSDQIGTSLAAWL